MKKSYVVLVTINKVKKRRGYNLKYNLIILSFMKKLKLFVMSILMATSTFSLAACELQNSTGSIGVSNSTSSIYASSDTQNDVDGKIAEMALESIDISDYIYGGILEPGSYSLPSKISVKTLDKNYNVDIRWMGEPSTKFTFTKDNNSDCILMKVEKFGYGVNSSNIKLIAIATYNGATKKREFQVKKPIGIEVQKPELITEAQLKEKYSENNKITINFWTGFEIGRAHV